MSKIKNIAAVANKTLATTVGQVADESLVKSIAKLVVELGIDPVTIVDMAPHAALSYLREEAALASGVRSLRVAARLRCAKAEAAWQDKVARAAVVNRASDADVLTLAAASERQRSANAAAKAAASLVADCGEVSHTSTDRADQAQA
jgi:hypothetical protein